MAGMRVTSSGLCEAARPPVPGADRTCPPRSAVPTTSGPPAHSKVRARRKPPPRGREAPSRRAGALAQPSMFEPQRTPGLDGRRTAPPARPGTPAPSRKACRCWTTRPGSWPWLRLGSLLLRPCTGRRGGRAHEGTVVAPASNRRWASDGFEVPCWNGEVVRIAIDTHDREVMSWVATSGAGISGGMVRDMMLDCVERRFAALRAPSPVQWLADNGSAYTAAETIDFAAALNLVPCFTPVRSPESNGVCEAFVKTFKRDYVRVNPRPDAITVLQHLTAWFEDYNTAHPHSGLRMPRRVSPSLTSHPPLPRVRPDGGHSKPHHSGRRIEAFCHLNFGALAHTLASIRPTTSPSKKRYAGGSRSRRSATPGSGTRSSSGLARPTSPRDRGRDKKDTAKSVVLMAVTRLWLAAHRATPSVSRGCGGSPAAWPSPARAAACSPDRLAAGSPRWPSSRTP